MARRKGTALAVPATTEQAQDLIAAYVQTDRQIIEIGVFYQRGIDELKAERDRLLGAIADDQAGRFASLKAWWEAGGQKLAGKGRSAEVRQARHPTDASKGKTHAGQHPNLGDWLDAHDRLASCSRFRAREV